MRIVLHSVLALGLRSRGIPTRVYLPYRVELDDRTYEADQVVIATGPFQLPRVPEMAERLNPDIVQRHSSAYRGPQDVPAGPVLVVGRGNNTDGS